MPKPPSMMTLEEIDLELFYLKSEMDGMAEMLQHAFKIERRAADLRLRESQLQFAKKEKEKAKVGGETPPWEKPLPKPKVRKKPRKKADKKSPKKATKKSKK